jgi:tetratricopeptide (TPR) repeat protein
MAERYAEALREATALKRKGDLAGAVSKIDEALRHAEVGNATIPPALRKRIFYLILAKRLDEAMTDALRLIEQSPAEVRWAPELIGTAYSFAYGERARVLLAMGRRHESFLDCVRALWYWQHAMTLQDRTKSEHTPASAAESLVEHVDSCGLSLTSNTVRRLVKLGLQDPAPDAMVSRFRMVLGEAGDASV